MTFKDFRNRIRTSGNVFGNTAHFGVSAEYRPSGGGVARTIAIHFERSTREMDDGMNVDEDVELKWFDVCKDPECPRGGIEDPKLGDSIVPEDDDPARPWTYQGKIRNETASSYSLLYGRRRPYAYHG